MKSLCIFGEVLFDHFPDGKKVLGGAPFNVAWHLQAFGQAPCFISRVGDDGEGTAIIKAMQNWGMSTDTLQLDKTSPTGRVTVSFNNGEPEYKIETPCAYDKIEQTSSKIDCGFFYHGSLALREPKSRQSAEKLKAAGCGTVFMDVNLRDPWWHKDEIKSFLHDADWVKLNDDELLHLADETIEDSQQGKRFLDTYDLQGLIITHGAEGAEVLLASGEKYSVKPQDINVTVVDTVGAGDAFTSIMIIGITNNWPLDITLRRAQDFASSLVQQRGATVQDINFYKQFIENWEPDF